MKNTDICYNHYYFDLLGLKYVETSAGQDKYCSNWPACNVLIFLGPLHKKFGQAWSKGLWEYGIPYLSFMVELLHKN